MASKEEVEAIIEKLAAGGASIPGLDIILIIENMVEIQVTGMESAIEAAADDIEQAKEDIAAMKVQLLEFFNTADAKAVIKAEINSIKNSAKQIAETLKSLPNVIQRAAAEAIMPSVVPTSGGVTNPSTIILKGFKLVNDIKTILRMLTALLETLLKSALKINFIPPDSILGMVDTIADIKQGLDKIPVP